MSENRSYEDGWAEAGAAAEDAIIELMEREESPSAAQALYAVQKATAHIPG